MKKRKVKSKPKSKMKKRAYLALDYQYSWNDVSYPYLIETLLRETIEIKGDEHRDSKLYRFLRSYFDYQLVINDLTSNVVIAIQEFNEDEDA